MVWYIGRTGTTFFTFTLNVNSISSKIMVMVFVTGYSQCLEGSGTVREVIWGMAIVRDDAAGAPGTSGPEIQAQGWHPWGLDTRQRGDVAEPRLPAVQAKWAEGIEEEAWGFWVWPCCTSGSCGTDCSYCSGAEVSASDTWLNCPYP